ncbi:MAG: hypothetical protein WCO98_01745, partial [bacterium]
IYWWRVRAGKPSGWGDWSKSSYFTTSEAPGNKPPSKVVVTPPQDATDPKNTVFTWTLDPNAVTYTCELSYDDKFLKVAQSIGGVTTLTWTPALPVKPISKVYCRVRGENHAGIGPWSDTVSFSTSDPFKKPLPIAPTNGLTNVPVDQPVQLEWDPNSSASLYEMQVSLYSNFNTILVDQKNLTKTVTEISNLGTGVTYYWRVRCGNQYFWGDWSDVSYFVTLNPYGAPALRSPADKATGLSTKVTLVWDDTPPATAYHIEVAKSADFLQSIFRTDTPDSNVTTPALDPNTTYYWRVRGGNGTYWGLYSTPQSFRTLDPFGTQPVLVLPLDAAVDLGRPTTLKWTLLPADLNYTVQVAIDNDFAKIINEQSGLVKDSTQMSNLATNTRYYWRVRAYLGVKVGPWSDVRSFTTASAFAVPSLLTPANNATGISLTASVATWTRVANASMYTIEISEYVDFSQLAMTKTNLTTPSSDISGLNERTVYNWRVRAGNGQLWGPWSDVRSFVTAAKIVYSVPILDTPADNASRVGVPVTLSWKSAPNASSYQIQLASDVNFVNDLQTPAATNATSVVVNGLKFNQLYYWRVRSGNGTDWGAWTTPFRFTTTQVLAKPKPTKPDNGSTSVPVPVNMTWDPVPNATVYHIQIAQDDTFTQNAYMTADLFTNSYDSTTLQEAVTYYWRVQAGNGATWSPWSDAQSFTTSRKYIAPLLTSPSNNATGQPVALTLEWLTSANATLYQVQVARDTAFTNKIVDVNDIPDPTLDIDNLVASTRYYWRVRAGDGNAWSPWSLMRSFTTSRPIDAPTLNSPSNNDTNVDGQNDVQFSWNNVDIGTANPRYDLQVATNSTFTANLQSSSNLTDTSVTLNINPNTKYYWRVRAKSGTSTGPWSNTWTFTTTN